MKLDRLVKLEKALEVKLDRLTRRKGAPEEPSEWVPWMLDEIEQRVVPSAGRGRVFPHDVIRVEVRVDPARIEAARAVFGARAFEDQIRERLRHARCEVPETLGVRVRVRPRADADEAPYAITCRKRTPARTADARDDARRATAAVPAVRILVAAGHARRRIHELKLERINLGRMESVEGRGAQRLRRNHVAFLDHEDAVNTTVSRAHAHIEYFAGDGFRIFDDGSAHGTRIVRDGRSIPVARGAVRGVKLRDRDEIELGLAKLTFLLEPPRPPSERGGVDS